MSLFYLKRVSKNKLTRMGISHYNMCHKTIWHEERIMMETLEEALQCIKTLRIENERLRAELDMYKNRNTGGRKKHDKAWMESYQNFADKYEQGMTIMEIVDQGEISRRTAYRYKAYYEELNKRKSSVEKL